LLKTHRRHPPPKDVPVIMGCAASSPAGLAGAPVAAGGKPSIRAMHKQMVNEGVHNQDMVRPSLRAAWARRHASSSSRRLLAMPPRDASSASSSSSRLLLLLLLLLHLATSNATQSTTVTIERPSYLVPALYATRKGIQSASRRYLRASTSGTRTRARARASDKCGG